MTVSFGGARSRVAMRSARASVASSTDPVAAARTGWAAFEVDMFAGLIAAVTAPTDVKAGTVIGQCMPRHRAQEFRESLDEVERNVPAGLDVHIVMDNASSHKTQAIRNLFAKRPRWHQHFTPTSSSWINQVERFFALLAEKQIQRGAHTSVKALIAAIEEFISGQNACPRPLRWTKSADDILASIDRFCRRTLEVLILTRADRNF